VRHTAAVQQQQQQQQAAIPAATCEKIGSLLLVVIKGSSC